MGFDYKWGMSLIMFTGTLPTKVNSMQGTGSQNKRRPLHENYNMCQQKCTNYSQNATIMGPHLASLTSIHRLTRAESTDRDRDREAKRDTRLGDLDLRRGWDPSASYFALLHRTNSRDAWTIQKIYKRNFFFCYSVPTFIRGRHIQLKW